TLAVASMIIGSYVPVGWFARRGGTPAHAPLFWILFFTLILLLIVHLPGIGKEVNGARRWIQLGPIGFQPSEFAKWGLVLALAAYAARRAVIMDHIWRGFFWPMGLVLVFCALIAKEDLGTAVLICAVSVGM